MIIWGRGWAASTLLIQLQVEVMEQPDFKTMMLPVGTHMELFLKPISRFHAVCTKGDMQTLLRGIQAYPMDLYHSLVPVSMTAHFITFTVTCSYKTSGTCDSKGGVGPVTFGEARGTGMHSV